MPKIDSLDYYETKCADDFKHLFFSFLESQRSLDKNENSIGKDIRNYFFKFFSTKEFRAVYENMAVELANKFDISEDDFLIQSVPTPRIFRPGDHGTNWHTDYWYGHGKQSRTVWVPIKGVVTGATFSAIAKKSDNEKLVGHYEKNPDLLTKGLDLFGFEPFEVLPPTGNVAIFSSQLLHGSILNNTCYERFSFDFRFTVRSDATSTKDLKSYLSLKDGKLVSVNENIATSNFLKYICGGQVIDTAAQHILIENMSRNNGIEIIAQEAEIERFGKPMLKFHRREILNGNSQFNGIVIASKSLLSDVEVTQLNSDKEVPIYFALENTWL
jgi:ectoine hydroxylase-related dioxygenase (phytanoyl-CoA dioxygenase family)